MANKLTLTDIQKEELIEVYRDKIKKLDQQKREYIDLISQLTGDQARPAKNQLQLSNLGTATPDSYDSNWSWSKKAFFILSTLKTCLTVREIFEKIAVYEPSMKESEKSERDNYQYLSSTISTKVSNKNTFGRYASPDKKGYLIGLIEWFDKNGDIRPNYKTENPN